MSAADTNTLTSGVAAALAGERLPVLEHEGIPTRRLTDREVQIIKALVKIFRDGFAGQTMADLAVGSGSSLRSLYRLAPSRSELVLLVTNQSLRQMAHEARKATKPARTPLEAVALYVHRIAMSAAKLSPTHDEDLAAVPAVRALAARYVEHQIRSIDLLLQQATEVGEIGPVDTRAFAVVIHGFIGAFTGVVGETQKAMVCNVDSAVATFLTGLVCRDPEAAPVWRPTD